MDLFVVRHGESPFHAGSDHSRPLSPRGQVQAGKSAQFIAQNCLNAKTHIICSDALRTMTTAKIIQQHLAAVQLHSDRQYYNALTGEWCDAILAHRHFEKLILVGHNPTMSTLSQYLIPSKSFQYKPACVGHFSLEIAADGLKLPAHFNELFSPDAIQ
ncbi:SixA phosphatase family protein [Marinicella litoralis]|uniref:Phosphohistidine phosphatase SixA n=1 Tax=Marinicella litoralis TaxID=644220 RepID=A0A4R6XTP0_9GAMM|nr:histidine phosphatase family protein [Marinicella litoralis]TDR23335.1 phosphohistidine phosphatase SixA [Marinicella litoralis]